MSNNIYNILGKLNALAPKEETPKTVEQKPVYESVEARGSVLEGIAKVESKLARMFAEEKANEDMLAKKDYDGDGKKESPKDEYMGSKDNAIKKAMGKNKVDEETHGQYLAQKEKEAQSSGKSSFQAFKQTHPVDGKPGVEEETEETEEEPLEEGLGDMFNKATQFVKHDLIGTGSGRRKDFETFLKKVEADGAIGPEVTQRLLQKFDRMDKAGADIDYLGKRIWKDYKSKSQVAEGFDDLQKYMADKAKGAKQGGGAGKKSGTRYGGSQQKDDEGDAEPAADDAPKKKGRPKKDKFAESADSTGHMLVEGALDKIAHQYSKEVKDFMANGDLDDDLFSALYDYYFDDMPYGTKKARDGDPYEWVAGRFHQDMNMRGLREAEPAPAAPAMAAPAPAMAPAAPAAGAAPVAESGAFIPGRTVYWRGKAGKVDRVEGNKCFVHRPNGEMDVWPTRECSTEKQGMLDTLKKDAIGMGQGIKNFVMNKPDPMDEELNELAKLAGLSEDKKCNSTMEGKSCPVHGLKECGSMNESAKPDYIDLDKDGDKEESMKDAAEDAEQVDEAGDFIKGIKRFVKGKQHPMDVRDNHLVKFSNAPDLATQGKEAARYDKIQKLIDKQNDVVVECGPGSMSPMSNMSQDEGNMSINTSMNSDGTKSVSVNATGNQADVLAQILKMAGLAAHQSVHGGEQEPKAIVIQAGPEEQVEEERDIEYANTPDEEVENVDAILHQGDDLNREKEQYAGMAKLGDNPMATRESIEMPARISRMLAGVKQAKW
jgi:hypothetical protein